MSFLCVVRVLSLVVSLFVIACLFVCLVVCLFVCLCLNVCVFVCLFVCLLACLFWCSVVLLFFRVYVHCMCCADASRNTRSHQSISGL